MKEIDRMYNMNTLVKSVRKSNNNIDNYIKSHIEYINHLPGRVIKLLEKLTRIQERLHITNSFDEVIKNWVKIDLKEEILIKIKDLVINYFIPMHTISQ